MKDFKDRILNMLTQKFVGFLAILVYGYFRPDQIGMAISGYALFTGGNVAVDYIRRPSEKATS